jgi:hypothetical protein
MDAVNRLLDMDEERGSPHGEADRGVSEAIGPERRGRAVLLTLAPRGKTPKAADWRSWSLGGPRGACRGEGGKGVPTLLKEPMLGFLTKGDRNPSAEAHNGMVDASRSFASLQAVAIDPSRCGALACFLQEDGNSFGFVLILPVCRPLSFRFPKGAVRGPTSRLGAMARVFRCRIAQHATVLVSHFGPRVLCLTRSKQ